MVSQKIPCSVLILTRNSAATLEKCLQNLGRFGEVLIHDGNSQDDTIEIAMKYGAKVLPQKDTAEKNLKITDFSAMRLKQECDAKYDWQIYLDSDEYLSDGAIDEIAEIVRTADKKTIVKAWRVWVIDGIPRLRGYLTPDIVPRMHCRGSGATFQKGKTVHEKFVYDSSFKEIILKSPLYVPLPNVAELRSKDQRYLLLDMERIRRDGFSWGMYVRWVLLREPAIIAVILLRMILVLPTSFSKDSVPFSHNFRFAWYHWRLMRAVTGLMFEPKN